MTTLKDITPLSIDPPQAIPELYLIAHIIHRAMCDLHHESQAIRSDAIRWIFVPDLKKPLNIIECCEFLELEYATLREAAARLQPIASRTSKYSRPHRVNSSSDKRKAKAYKEAQKAKLINQAITGKIF